MQVASQPEGSLAAPAEAAASPATVGGVTVASPLESGPAPTLARPKVLCVDDEPHLLVGLRHVLGRTAEVVTALGGEEGLRILADQGPFSVVISDFAMPRMNGVQFLQRARQLAPDTIRMLFTGNASLPGAIDAVNEGGIFRFLLKPCPPHLLVRALEDAFEQRRMTSVDRELLQRKLDEMTGQLLRAERLATLGTMAGAIGHELNNVLTAYQCMVNLVKREAEAGRPAAAEDLLGLDQVGAHLATHAKNLLRIGHPTEESGISVTDLARAVRDATQLLRSAGVLGRVDFSSELPIGQVAVTLQHTEAEQILINLIRNAIDAAVEAQGRDHRLPRVEVRLRLNPKDRVAECSVVDNGTGIRPDQLERIFDPYFTTKPSDRGTGLGLFVVRQIVDRRGGTVAAESVEGRGATFTVKIPLADEMARRKLKRMTSGVIE